MGNRSGNSREARSSQPASTSKFVNTKEAANHFGVSVDTLRKWARDGGVKNVQPAGPGGRRLIPKDALV